jgi:outer membrane protein insertion porin family
MPSDQRPLVRIAIWLSAICFSYVGFVSAQDGPSNEPPRVVAVRVVTESGTVLEENPPELTIQPGQPFSMDAESASLRQLFHTGRFADVSAELTNVPGGVRVDFVVRQNLYINRAQIVGLREPPSESLAISALRLNVGEVFRESDRKEALDRLRQTLEDDGLYQVKIDYETTPHPDTLQVDILVRVTPGPRARIGSITIKNETDFSEEELRDRLKLKIGREITSDRLNRAAESARKWLAKKDYLGARVTLHRGPYDAETNTVPLEATFHAGSQVRVTVEGGRVSDRTLRKLVPIYEEGAVDEDLLQEGRRALREWFQRAGYFDAQVNYTTSDLPAQKSANSSRTAATVVVYHVMLGDRHRLVGVEFSGNKYFSTALLTARLKIQPAGYASPGRYSSTLLQDDVASIRTLYDANGFHEVEVRPQIIDDYKGHHGELFVRFEIKEGQQTRVADLVVEGNQHLSQDELLGVVGSTPGQPYSEFNVSSDRDNILALYYNQGFSEARFSADVEKVPPSNPNEVPRVRLKYHIIEGRQVLVASVLLGGYEHTRRGVISRQVGIRPGAPLSEGAVVETQRKLYNLGIFSRVSIAPQNPEGQETQKTVVVMVDEAKRYTLAYGLGFEAQRLGSGATGTGLSAAPRAILEITKANFTGRADALSFKVRASTIQGRAQLAYTAPNYFASPNFNLQLLVFFDKARIIQTFTSKRYEASLQLSQRLSNTSSVRYRYAFRKVNTVLNVNTITAEQLPLFNQNTDIAEFGASWLKDRRNNPADPTRGDVENIDLAVAIKPVGSSVDFIRVFLENSTYHPIGRRLVFARSARFGVQTPYDKTLSSAIPLPERFFAGGGTSLRGFALNQAGPRDPISGFPIGGQALLVFNQDLRFPMHLPVIGNRLGGAVFYDTGNVFPSIRKISLRTSPPVPTIGSTIDAFNRPTTVCLTNCTNELNYFSHTVGFEFRYGTPIGPVALDLGYLLNPARFIVQTGTCPATAAAGCQATISRLPSFQFFINLGATF